MIISCASRIAACDERERSQRVFEAAAVRQLADRDEQSSSRRDAVALADVGPCGENCRWSSGGGVKTASRPRMAAHREGVVDDEERVACG